MQKLILVQNTSGYSFPFLVFYPWIQEQESLVSDFCIICAFSKEALFPMSQYVVISPFPFTSISPRSSNSNCGLGSFWIKLENVSLQCILNAEIIQVNKFKYFSHIYYKYVHKNIFQHDSRKPVDSMRDAVFTVSPKRQ